MSFAIFRILLGLYIFGVAVELWPWLDQLYTADGWMPVVATPHASLVSFRLLAYDSPMVLRVLCGLVLLGSLFIAAGVIRKIEAVVVFSVFWFFFHRNLFAVTEEYAFVMWLLLATLVVPSGEPLRLFKKAPAPGWFFPEPLRKAAWVVLAVGYTSAGLFKVFQSESFWLRGSALKYLVSEGLARRTWYGEWHAWVPDFIYIGTNWLLIAVQLFALPLLMTKKSRLFLWWSMVLFHVGAMLTLRLTSVSLGMLVFHLFIYFPFIRESSATPGSERKV